MENLDPFERWQLERYGNILGSGKTTPEGELFENGIEQLERLAAWIEMQNEKVQQEKEF
jgi:hypothetical protein